jgi:hypothetical protein
VRQLSGRAPRDLLDVVGVDAEAMRETLKHADATPEAPPGPRIARRLRCRNRARAVAPWGTDRLLLWYDECDSAGPVILCASTPSHTAAASRAEDVPWLSR